MEKQNLKILVTGASGQLGFDVCRLLKERGYDTHGIDKNELDITDEKIVSEYFSNRYFDCIIHCSAYTAVDKAETERELCMLTNAQGTLNLAKQIVGKETKFLYISTDYVFQGDKDGIYETNDECNPINLYGESKLLGEKYIENLLSRFFIIRTSWVFGANGNNFIKTMLRLGKERDTLSIVKDQIGSPSYTEDLALLIESMIQTDKYGIYHATNEGFCSWADFASEIFSQSGINTNIVPITSSEYITPAKRPLNSRLSKEKLIKNGFNRLPSWQSAVSRFLEKL